MARSGVQGEEEERGNTEVSSAASSGAKDSSKKSLHTRLPLRGPSKILPTAIRALRLVIFHDAKTAPIGFQLLQVHGNARRNLAEPEITTMPYRHWLGDPALISVPESLLDSPQGFRLLRQRDQEALTTMPNLSRLSSMQKCIWDRTVSAGPRGLTSAQQRLHLGLTKLLHRITSY